MNNLLKADFYNMRKKKLIFWILVGAVAWAIMIVLVYKGIDYIMAMATEISEAQGEEGDFNFDIFGSLFNAEVVYRAALAIANGYGLVAGIAVCIFCSSQFGSGIIRNKIISGAKRTEIYLSTLICSAVIMIGIMLVHDAVMLGFCQLIFGFEKGSIGEMLKISGMYMINYLAFVSVFVSLSMCFKSIGGSMAVGIGEPLGMNIIMSILAAAETKFPEIAQDFLMLFPSFHSISLAGGMLPLKETVISIIGDVAVIIIFNVIGIIVFNKTDLK